MRTVPFQVLALYDYHSAEPGDLTFEEGQVIEVTSDANEDWYEGKYEIESGDVRQGIFPQNFVQLLEASGSTERDPTHSQHEAGQSDDVNERPDTLVSQPISVEDRPIGVASPEQDASQEQAIDHDDYNIEVPNQHAQEDSVARSEANPAQTAPELEPHGHVNTQQDMSPVGESGDKSNATSLVTESDTSNQIKAQDEEQPPLPTSTKPINKVASSFKDRISAFNVPGPNSGGLPLQPRGLIRSNDSGFVKKGFVAAPPSRNAFVPLPRESGAYQPKPIRDAPRNTINESSGLSAHDAPNAEVERPNSATNSDAAAAPATDDVPKPTSLKERIALLQQSQLEQAVRHSAKASPKRSTQPSKPDLASATSSPRMKDSDGNSLSRVATSEIPEVEPASHLQGPAELSDSRANIQSKRESRPTETLESPLEHQSDMDQDQTERKQSLERVSTTQTEAHEMRSSSNERTEHKDDKEANGSEEEDEEEDAELDPEIQRRIKIRNRMAKMSGGMGLAGIIGPPVSLPSSTSKRRLQRPDSDADKSDLHQTDPGNDHGTMPSRVPIMPMLPQAPKSVSTEQLPEDAQSDSPSLSRGDVTASSPESKIKSQVDYDTNEPASRTAGDSSQIESATDPGELSPVATIPPSIQADEGADSPLTPPAQRKTPSMTKRIASQSEGFESDDELSTQEPSSATLGKETNSSQDEFDHSDTGHVASLQESYIEPTHSTNGSSKFSDRSVPIPPREPARGLPDTEAVHTLHSSAELPIQRKPPPIPPPAQPQRSIPPPPPRRSQTPPQKQISQTIEPIQLAEEEVTEYEGDYDTDIGSGEAHKGALKNLARRDQENDPEEDGASNNPPPPPQKTTRPLAVDAASTIPFQPSNQQQQTVRGGEKGRQHDRNDEKSIHKRQSSDMPRAAPPPPPACPPPSTKSGALAGPSSMKDLESTSLSSPSYSEPNTAFGEDYDPFNYERSISSTTSNQPLKQESAKVPRAAPPPLPTRSAEFSLPAPSHDPAHPSKEMRLANDIDLCEASQWWTKPHSPPPSLLGRTDIIYEVDENTNSRRGGKKIVTVDVYVLYADYSQTSISVHYDPSNPGMPTLLEQRHESAPQQLRPVEMEKIHADIGMQIAKHAAAFNETIVGDGHASSLALELIRAIPGALQPVGPRSYGAVVFASLDGSIVQELDQIRPGDIVTFRNATLGEHRGADKTKYSIVVGEPDHVAVVLDWDESSKQLRVWEQARDGKATVSLESFNLGDLKSGEIKVWRVMPRSWVGWES